MLKASKDLILSLFVVWVLRFLPLLAMLVPGLNVVVNVSFFGVLVSALLNAVLAFSE